jgi:hypothetical protein
MTKTEIAFHAEELLASALQIVAAFVLTDEEVHDSAPDARPGNLVGWAKAMREDLLSEDNRPQLVAILKARGFYTNSHAGFPLAALSAPGPRQVEIGIEKCEAIAGLIRSKEIEYDLHTGPADMTARLVADGMSEAVASWMVRAHGTSMFLIAFGDVLTGRTRPPNAAA